MSLPDNVLFAAPVSAWTVVDDGDPTLTFPIDPERMGDVAAAVADPSRSVFLAVIAVPRNDAWTEATPPPAAPAPPHNHAEPGMQIPGHCAACDHERAQRRHEREVAAG